jgi:hypothetical protein
MKEFNEMLEERMKSKEWSLGMAEKVNARRAKARIAKLTAMGLAASFVVVFSVVSMQQHARENSLKNVFASAMEEVYPSSDNSQISFGMDR